MSKWETGSRCIFFSDPGMEMMPGCRDCMCYNHSKTSALETFHFFNVFANFVSPGRVLGVIFVTFVDLGDTFSDI